MSKGSPVNEPLAIVGMACRFPKADGVDAYWGNIINRTDCIEEIPDSHWSPEDYFNVDPKTPDMTYGKRGGFLDEVPFHSLEFGIPPKTIEATDTSQLLGMVVAREALEDAGYGKEGKQYDRERTSVILGVTGALELVIPLGARLGHPIWRKALREAGLNEEQTEAIVQKIADGYVPWQEQSFPGLLGNVVAGRIANALDLGGTNCVADAACASALSAVHLAALELQAGRADMVITGGVDTFNDIFMYMCFSKTPALSPTGNARPFDTAGDGTILGEGLGMVCLKRLVDAERDGDHIYAVLKGMGSSSDGKGNAIYAPSAAGQQRALRRAYENAEVSPATVELVEGHGTGTKVGDNIELTALQEVFRDSGAQSGYTAVGSVKSQIGHTKAAAGIAGLMKIAIALDRKVLPATIKVDQPLDKLLEQDSPLYLGGDTRPWAARREHKRRASVSAFGFGGSNFHAVLEEYQTTKQHVDWDGKVQILSFSDKDRQGLKRQLAEVNTNANWPELTVAAARARLSYDADAPMRLLLVLEQDKTDVSRIVENAKVLLDKYTDRRFWNAPEGIYFGSGEAPGKLGVLFPGQGAQYVGMLRDLAVRFPEMQGVLGDVDKAFADTEDFGDGDRLIDLIYPRPSFDGDENKRRETRLRETQNAQPAIGAVSIGALKVLNRFGIKPMAAAGHSYGEVTALCASERFDADALYLLSRLRGKLMAAGDGDRGSMLAVRAPVERLERFVAEHNLDLVPANKNAPDQVVLSGATREVERAVGLLEQEQISCKRLPVAAAFHSTLVAQASEPFRAQLQTVDFPAATIPVYSNTTATPYPEAAEAARELLATQLTKPVEFVSEIRNMTADGIHTFLEVGPGARLTGLVKSILKDEAFEAVAVDASNGKRSGAFDLAKCLAHLSALGYGADIAAWENSAEQIAKADRPRKGPAVMINGANYTDPATKARAEKPIEKVVEPARIVEKVVHVPAPATAPVPQAQAAPQQPSAPTPAAPMMQQPAVPNNAVGQAFQNANQHMQMLQQMQQETARVHLKFLETQEQMQQSLNQLMQQQRSLMGGQPMTVPATVQPVAPVAQAPAPAPVVPQPVVAEQVSAPKPIAAAPAPVSQAPVASPPAAQTEPVRDGAIADALLAIVAEKTGYPLEMLESSMSLDGDLGIDSIKRVEILSALQEALPHLPAVEPDRMGSLQTLADIIGYLESKQPAQAPNATPQVHEATSGVDQSQLQQQLMGIVAEKTGYPQEMLELSMSLDADLGIDSIKRVEILSALQEAAPNLPAVEPDRMGSLQTLGDIVTYLAEKSGSNVTAPAPAPAPASAPAVAGREGTLLDIVAEKTGYPAEMLTTEMSLDADLGIDSIKRVEILSALQEAVPSLPAVEPDHMGSLQTLGDILNYLGADAQPAQVVVASVVPQAPVSGVWEALRAVVAEKTGYPEDMLENGMSLDADLGIDSIKRVEILSALQEALPDLPAVAADRMGALETLGDVVAELSPAGQAAEATPTAPSADLSASLLHIVAEKTGYPSDMLEPNMGLEEDLGIDSIKRVEILSALQESNPGLPEVSPDQMGTLRTLGEIIAYFDQAAAPQAPVVAAPVVTAPVAKESSDLGIRRQILIKEAFTQTGASLVLQDLPLWLVGPDVAWINSLTTLLRKRGFQARRMDIKKALETIGSTAIAGLILCGNRRGNVDQTLEDYLMLTKAAAPVLKQSHGLFAGVTSLDGAFGLNGFDQKGAAEMGALAGLVKTASHEWPEVHCRAFDLGDRNDLTLQTLAREICARGPIETGVTGENRLRLVLVDEDLPQGGMPHLEKGDLVVVTGGARGVTAAVATGLAKASPTLLLLGRGAAPADQEPAWAVGIDDEAALKSGIMNNSEARLTPRDLNQAFNRLMAEREMRTNIAAMQTAGATVLYRSVDLRDADAVKAAVDEARAQAGPVRGVIHGAGVLADRRIEDKTREQFQQVYNTKVHGWRNLLSALDGDDPRFAVLFSSSTGRFGRTGQVDYAMANEVLNKSAAHMAATRPGCRVVSVNWGPWRGGMVTPALEKLFRQEGVGLISLQAGTDYLLSELAQPVGPREVVILGRTDAPPPSPKAVTPEGEYENLPEVFNLTMHPDQQPFLRHHVMQGKAVLPMAVMVEWLAHAALCANPGFRFGGFDNLTVLKGVVFDGEPVVVSARAGNFGQDEDGIHAETALRIGDRDHVHARVLLLDQPAAAPQPGLQLSNQGRRLDAETAYGHLFHGPTLQGIEFVEQLSDDHIAAAVRFADEPSSWMKDPLRGSWLADPLVLDCVFQLMIVWCAETHGKPSLPVSLGGYRQYGPFSGKVCRVVSRITSVRGAAVTADVELLDGDRLIARLTNYTCIMDGNLAESFRHNRLTADVT